MEKNIYNKENGLCYTLGDDGFYYPNLVFPKQKYAIGRFGQKHLDYLKKHRPLNFGERL